MYEAVFRLLSVLYSVTSMLLDLNLPSFDTIMYNSKLQFTDSLNRCNNNLVKLYRALS